MRHDAATGAQVTEMRLDELVPKEDGYVRAPARYRLAIGSAEYLGSLLEVVEQARRDGALHPDAERILTQAIEAEAAHAARRVRLAGDRMQADGMRAALSDLSGLGTGMGTNRRARRAAKALRRRGR